MHEDPVSQHLWLQRLVGEWTFEQSCVMEPDSPPATFVGREVVRSFGDLWMIGESEFEMGSGQTVRSIITLGYDPKQARFVGSCVVSMMSHFWIYNGSLDAAGRVLTLDTEGPRFDGTGLTRYKDILEIHSNDSRTLSSTVLLPDGNWFPFMVNRGRRVGSA